MSISQCLVRRTVESGFTLDRNRSESGRSFWCEQVHEFLSIRWIGFRGEDAMSFQLAQPIGQYVRRDALIRFHRLLVRSESAEHHAADDQQRPVLAQHLHGGIQWTPQQPLRRHPLAWQICTNIFTCIAQVRCRTLTFAGEAPRPKFGCLKHLRLSCVLMGRTQDNRTG